MGGSGTIFSFENASNVAGTTGSQFITASFPTTWYTPKEIGGLHAETTEVAGAFWIVSNATYDAQTSNWYQSAPGCNPAFGAAAIALQGTASGQMISFYSAAATLDVNVPVSWALVYQAVNGTPTHFNAEIFNQGLQSAYGISGTPSGTVPSTVPPLYLVSGGVASAFNNQAHVVIGQAVITVPGSGTFETINVTLPTGPPNVEFTGTSYLVFPTIVTNSNPAPTLAAAPTSATQFALSATWPGAPNPSPATLTVNWLAIGA